MPHEVSPESSRSAGTVAPVYEVNIWGRLSFGIIVALGVYVGIRKLVMGTTLALLDDAQSWWMTVNGLTVVYTAQAIAVTMGSVLAAAGRSRGFGYGAAVGIACGVLFLGFELMAGASQQALVIYLQPIALAGLGLLAGMVGSRVWSASPILDIPVPNPSKLSSMQFAKETVYESGRPTHWIRVLASAAIIVCGVTLAEPIKHYAQRYSGGLLRVQSLGQGEFITFQLATFAALVGGILAGASTGSGIRHGLIAGALGGIGVLGVCLKQGGAIPSVAFWLEKLDIDDLPLLSPTVCLTVSGSVLIVGLVGGWMGGAMFLPLAPSHMQKRLRLGSD